mmetsp:Transcript_35818/g.26133  ORF Transcript_35818/g.26133 Transcript_35818/m.26133 type:complete len:84 (-) Transcript_35818:1425-1676(-)
MPALEILSLSVNSIATLEHVGHCPLLKELYLRRNQIGSVKELNYLKKCPNLKTLWLDENPVASAKNYRLICIRNCPSLEKLDN